MDLNEANEKTDLVKQKYGVILKDGYIQKSNVLVMAKAKLSLISEKVLLLGLMNIQVDTSNGEQLYADLDGYYIRYMLGISSHSLYDRLRDACVQSPEGRRGNGKKASLADFKVIHENPATNSFEVINVFSAINFTDGILHMRFNRDFNPYLCHLRSDYTKLKTEHLFAADSIYSFRLYEIAMHDIYELRNTMSMFKVYDLTELKLLLGVINSNGSKKIQTELQKQYPDYEKIQNWAEENKLDSYKTWGDFKKNVLDKTIPELRKFNIDLSYFPIRGGRGGKIKQIKFGYAEIKPSVFQSEMINADDLLLAMAEN